MQVYFNSALCICFSESVIYYCYQDINVLMLLILNTVTLVSNFELWVPSCAHEVNCISTTVVFVSVMSGWSKIFPDGKVGLEPRQEGEERGEGRKREE